MNSYILEHPKSYNIFNNLDVENNVDFLQPNAQECNNVIRPHLN